MNRPRTRSLSGVANGTGVAVLEVTAPQGADWLVQRISVASSAAGTVRAYVGAEASENIVDGTASGGFDISDNAQPILVSAGETLRLVWTGLAANDRVSARMQYVDMSFDDWKQSRASVFAPIERIPFGHDMGYSGRKITVPYGGDNFS